MIQAAPSLQPVQSWRPSRHRRDSESLHEDSLHLALEQVLACEDAGPAFRDRLERYAPFLAAEFEEEEAACGLLGEVLEVEPCLAHRVEAARREHREILAALQRLIELLGREAADSASAWQARRALLGKLRAHRRAEERLLQDAHFQDVGGEGA